MVEQIAIGPKLLSVRVWAHPHLALGKNDRNVSKICVLKWYLFLKVSKHIRELSCHLAAEISSWFILIEQHVLYTNARKQLP